MLEKRIDFFFYVGGRKIFCGSRGNVEDVICIEFVYFFGCIKCFVLSCSFNGMIL